MSENIKTMEWIDIKNINNYEIDDKQILIWQFNMSDENSSRFQRAIYIKGKVNFIKTFPYPGSYFKKDDNNEFFGYDLEGDLCKITHFAIINSPKI